MGISVDGPRQRYIAREQHPRRHRHRYDQHRGALVRHPSHLCTNIRLLPRNGPMGRILSIPYVRYPLCERAPHRVSSPPACSTTVTVELSFGGNNWTMSSADFQFASISSSECIGAFFDISTTTTTVGGSSTVPSWIIGDAFLVSPLCVVVVPAHRRAR